jgi:hypothetical protein
MNFRRVLFFGLLIFGSLFGFIALALIIADEMAAVGLFVAVSAVSTFAGLVTAVTEIPFYRHSLASKYSTE